MDVTLRPALAEDEPFLYELYATTREEELSLLDWDAAERARFLRLQFDAQRTHYTHVYPAAKHSIIMRDGAPVGRIWIERNDEEIRVLDIALLPAHRGAGIGSRLLKQLIREAEETGQQLRHSVEKNNPAAMRLYQRLGFEVVGEIPTHFFLEYRSAGESAQ